MLLKKLFLTVCLIVLATSVTSLDQKTQWETGSAHAYALNKHGPDGALFLDPFFIPYLVDLQGQKLLDAGCGTAPWSIIAAEHGAQVFGIDINKDMLDLAKLAVEAAGCNSKIILEKGDVTQLPYQTSFFDRAISLLVGCNLPPTKKVEGGQVVGFATHMIEMARVLKKDAIAVVTAPASFGVVFTNGSPKQQVINHIHQVLEGIKDTGNSAMIVSSLNELKEVYRATFAIREGKIVLVTDEMELQSGEKIWRKLPGLTVPNYYHSESEYLQAFSEAGLELIHINRPHFLNEKEMESYNGIQNRGSLGAEYIDNHPFVIFCVKKK